MTNREWIESLSDERLARLFGVEFCDNYCTCSLECSQGDDCVEGITKWLQQEHKKTKERLRWIRSEP